MGLVQASPKDGAYVTEWVALRFDGANFGLAKRLMANSQCVARIVLDGAAEGPSSAWIAVTQVHGNGVQTFEVKQGDWIIRSPHGRFWFMDDSEYTSQFEWTPEA